MFTDEIRDSGPHRVGLIGGETGVAGDNCRLRSRNCGSRGLRIVVFPKED